LRVITRFVQPTESIEVIQADPTDDRILECAVAAGAEVIVSGDTHLLGLGRFRGILIQRVAEFLDRLQDQGRD
jgi:predicted nucleic acid-binding protein